RCWSRLPLSSDPPFETAGADALTSVVAHVAVALTPQVDVLGRVRQLVGGVVRCVIGVEQHVFDERALGLIEGLMFGGRGIRQVARHVVSDQPPNLALVLVLGLLVRGERTTDASVLLVSPHETVSA